MRGHKVTVTFEDGSEEKHFVADRFNNLQGAKSATDTIHKHYETKGIPYKKMLANFFDDQREGILPKADHLPGLSAQEKCWCGYWKRGECKSCPDELSFADNKFANVSK
jgi:hypothetical protein